MNTSAPEKIKGLLHEALGNLDKFEECILLDYPNHRNIGDHLIWLGELFYLTDVMKTKISYVAHLYNWSAAAINQQVSHAPILLTGGGNLGDIWPNFQKFRELIISKFHDRPIIIFPQTIYFTDPSNLQKAADIFNAHPNLTLLVRDDYSYEIAIKHFHKCRIIKSPDMAFQMVNMPEVLSDKSPNPTTLYLCRKDKELSKTLSVESSFELDNLLVEDWASYRFPYRELPKPKTPRNIVRGIREGWKKGTLLTVDWLPPQEWMSLQTWKSSPSTSKFDEMYNPVMHQRSWNFMHQGVYQLRQHRLVITNRLHGHILSTLLGIPHIFLANSYHKNQAFYEAWTHQVPFCKFAKDVSQVKVAAQELMESFPT